ncbi:hypothetical protein H6798_01245 [Candidatus Nomurabacteria bacterium]|nr:hypothetical protein [Candidatus Nomurabacteria bacterium]
MTMTDSTVSTDNLLQQVGAITSHKFYEVVIGDARVILDIATIHGIGSRQDANNANSICWAIRVAEGKINALEGFYRKVEAQLAAVREHPQSEHLYGRVRADIDAGMPAIGQELQHQLQFAQERLLPGLEKRQVSLDKALQILARVRQEEAYADFVDQRGPAPAECFENLDVLWAHLHAYREWNSVLPDNPALRHMGLDPSVTHQGHRPHSSASRRGAGPRDDVRPKARNPKGKRGKGNKQ